MPVEWLTNKTYNDVLGKNYLRQKPEDKFMYLSLEALLAKKSVVFNLLPLGKELKQGTVFVELMGMPGAGKDTLLDQVGALGLNWVQCGKEPYTSIKEADNSSLKDRLKEEAILLAATLAEMISGDLGLMRRGVFCGGLSIGNRGLLDHRVMARAKYKNGEISFREYTESGQPAAAMDVTVALMVDPDTASERIRLAGREGEHSTIDFLKILHKEYALEIFNSINNGTNNLVVMDMTGSREGNLDRFRKTISGILGKKL